MLTPPPTNFHAVESATWESGRQINYTPSSASPHPATTISIHYIRYNRVILLTGIEIEFAPSAYATLHPGHALSRNPSTTPSPLPHRDIPSLPAVARVISLLRVFDLRVPATPIQGCWRGYMVKTVSGEKKWRAKGLHRKYITEYGEWYHIDTTRDTVLYVLYLVYSVITILDIKYIIIINAFDKTWNIRVNKYTSAHDVCISHSVLFGHKWCRYMCKNIWMHKYCARTPGTTRRVKDWNCYYCCHYL